MIDLPDVPGWMFLLWGGLAFFSGWMAHKEYLAEKKKEQDDATPAPEPRPTCPTCGSRFKSMRLNMCQDRFHEWSWG